MSELDDFEQRGAKRAHGGPYTAKHPVPTVQGYRQHKADLKERQEEEDRVGEDVEFREQNDRQDGGGDPDQSRPKRAYESLKAIAKDQDKQGPKGSSNEPYSSVNRNDPSSGNAGHGIEQPQQQDGQKEEDDSDNDESSKKKQNDKAEKESKSATEQAASSIDPKEKRKAMKKKKSRGGREVTDPVTHLPITIHDMTDKHLDNAPENEPPVGETHRTRTGVAGKSDEELQIEEKETRGGHDKMRKLFPPPDFEVMKIEMMSAYKLAVLAVGGVVGVMGLLGLGTIWMTGPSRPKEDTSWFHSDTGHHSRSWTGSIFSVLTLAGIAATGVFLVHTISGLLSKKVDSIFEDETWDAARHEEEETNETEGQPPESVAWLNSLLASIWPLINPDLFAALVDTLEDVMQASLPKVVRMVSVDDIGQGSEAIRILGVKWLPTGAAGQSIDSSGQLESTDQTAKEKENEQGKGSESTQEGMEAEEGDFVNLEVAFAYRARTSGKSIKAKARNAHLYLKFYLPGDIAIPVWVELRGIVGIMRLRLQLTPDPPFFELCTITFLGQPKADLSCVPLSKHNLNIMNVPFISSFVQSAVDAALAEYVAPKSLTLDLKDMLMGEDFKKDTMARGAVVVYIKHARGFKHGDGGLGPIEGSSDAYVTVSWGKFGKPMASTRIIVDDQTPTWNEWAYVLVSPDELNAEETLRLQIWDSDKYTADDDLGRVEVSLKELMHDSKTKNRLCDREDQLMSADPDEEMPGTLSWSVGYFSKSHIMQSQLDAQTFDPSTRKVEDLKSQVAEEAKSKLREASPSKDMTDELKQQSKQDYKEKEDEMIISAPPPSDYPSGILSIQIHNITGLEVANLNRDRKTGNEEDTREDEAEQSDGLPDSYCNIILNHRKIYRTRTKPKNAKPFFNAGTERFVRDWKTAEVIVSVRDSREGENDPVLGVVYLPLGKVFEHRSQVMQTYPLAGGVGYGRVRISMLWRSVELQMGRELLGWDYGTLEVKGPIRVKSGLDDGLKQCKLKVKSKIGSAKMYSSFGEERDDGWTPKKHRRHENEGSVFLGIINRYSTGTVFEFRNSKTLTSDSNPALAVLWMSSIPDEEEKTVTLQVWKGGKKQLKKARTCADYQGLEEGEQPLGEIELTVRFWRGLSGYHQKWAQKASNKDTRGVMEVLDIINDEKMGEDDMQSDLEEDSSSSTSDSDGSDTETEETSSRGVKRSGSDDWSHLGDDDDYPYDKPNRQGSSHEEIETRKMLRKAGTESASSEDEHDGATGSAANVKKIPAKLKERASSLIDGKTSKEKDSGKRGPISQMEDYKKSRKQLHRKHRGVMQWKAARTLDWMGDKLRDGKGKVGEVFEHGEKGKKVETEV